MSKKSKSQQCGGGEKNGLALGTSPAVGTAPAEDSMLVDEQDTLTTGTGASTGVAANLFRKKATPPQPAGSKKKLVIKMHKGISSLYPPPMHTDTLTLCQIFLFWFERSGDSHRFPFNMKNLTLF